MATQTYNVAYYEDGAVRAGYEYDDVELRITRLFSVNNGTGVHRLIVTRESDGATQTFDTDPGETNERNIGGGAAARLGITLDAKGRPRGVVVASMYPYIP